MDAEYRQILKRIYFITFQKKSAGILAGKKIIGTFTFILKINLL